MVKIKSKIDQVNLAFPIFSYIINIFRHHSLITISFFLNFETADLNYAIVVPGIIINLLKVSLPDLTNLAILIWFMKISLPEAKETNNQIFKTTLVLADILEKF